MTLTLTSFDPDEIGAELPTCDPGSYLLTVKTHNQGIAFFRRRPGRRSRARAPRARTESVSAIEELAEGPLIAGLGNEGEVVSLRLGVASENVVEGEPGFFGVVTSMIRDPKTQRAG